MQPSTRWFQIGLSAWALGAEASAVVALRTLKLMQGGIAAEAESRRMIEEKLKAAFELQTKAITGGLQGAPHTIVDRTLKHYRRKVRANRRRLSRRKRR
jgi:hypothetical protein